MYVSVSVAVCSADQLIAMHNLSGVVSTTDAYQFGALTRRHLYPCVHVCSWVCVCGLMWKRARTCVCVVSLSQDKSKSGRAATTKKDSEECMARPLGNTSPGTTIDARDGRV